MPYRFRPAQNKRKLRGIRFLLAGVALFTACAEPDPAAPLALVGVPGQINEHVSIASDRGSVVALTWAASSESGATNIFASVSVDEGASFSSPVRVNATDGQVRVNGEQPPRVALVPGADGSHTIVVLWTAKAGDTTSLLLSLIHI